MPSGAPRPGERGHAHRGANDDDRSRRELDRLLAYETILEHSRLNVTIYDRDLFVRDVSRVAAEHAHMTRETMIGCSLRDYLPPEYVTTNERAIAGEMIEIEGKLAPELGPGELWTHVHILPIRDGEGVVQGGTTIVADVSEQRRADELIEKLAFVDSVTDLPNRAMLSMMLEGALSGAKASHRQLALVWLNLDRFKDVNDGLGQQVGDELLRAVGERLHEHVRTNDIVAHAGADDFVLLLPRVNSGQHLERLVARVHEVFGEPFLVGDEAVFLTASCGIAVHPNGGADARQLQENAHTAMRVAKQFGGGACELFDPGVAEDSSGRLRLAREIREGIEQGAFTMHYQPIVDLGTMQTTSVEALARWNHPKRGLVSPAEFIPFAEESGLIVTLGRHLLTEACGHLKGWHAALEAPPRVCVNVSAREVQRSDVCDGVKRAAARAGIAPSSLEIEFTETAVLANPARAAEVARCLSDAGASVSLDDFGTGYSSLTHLHQLPIDRVKIDRSFVGSCLSDRSASSILVGVTHLAHDLGMEVVAEGVESEAQLEFVKAVGCDAAQGYHLARPLPHAEATEHLRRAAKGPVL